MKISIIFLILRVYFLEFTMAYPSQYDLKKWLPTTAKEVKLRNWDSIDVILFTGDAYIDHPSFGAAVMARLMEREGLRVAIVPQPNWKDDKRDFKKLGKPNLFFAVTAGNMDSMVNHYTANKRLRSNDAYTPDGRKAARPDYASIVYCNILREIYPDTPIVLGGVEASLRRLTHYDYWSNQLKPGILEEAPADILLYGMAEKSMLKLIKLVQKNVPISKIKDIPQTAYITKDISSLSNKEDKIKLFSHEECLQSKKKYAQNFKHIEQESNMMQGKILYQKVKDKWIVINPAHAPEEDGAIDQWYDLPYTRLPHPKYWKKGPIPAYEMIKFSVNMHRGCFGGCSFCTISAHQGKFVVNRSKESILKEVEEITKAPDFKGYISDLGGPSANMYKMRGIDLKECEPCKRPSCIHPNVCHNLDVSHDALLEVYQEARNVKGIKKAFIGSGIRYDLVLAQSSKKAYNYLKELMKHHVSGKLKVAPEHTSDKVLHLMRKPNFESFKKFTAIFNRINREEQLNELLIPYFISSHPGSEKLDMADLAAETKAMNFRLEQIQDFTPTPMTVATVIFYSGLHPYTLKPVFTAKSQQEKRAQRKYFFWYKKEYRQSIIQELKKWKRFDLLEKLMKK